MATRGFSWHPDWKVRYALLLIPVIIGLVFLWVGPREKMARLVGWGFTLMPALGMIESVATVDTERRTLERRWRWFGWVPLWSKMEGLESFEAVSRRRCSDRGRGTDWVVLVRKSQRFVWISYFRVSDHSPCPKAKAEAERLSEVTGLPLSEYPDLLFSRRSPDC
jgi:hypothetical protein